MRFHVRSFIALCAVMVAVVGCGSEGRPRSSESDVENVGVPSDPQPVKALKGYGWSNSRMERLGEVLLLPDNGFPTNMLRFDLTDEAGSARIVNPPVALYQPSVVPMVDSFLVVGMRCDRPELIQEPRCEGGVVAYRYWPDEDQWESVGEVTSEWVALLYAYPDGAGSALVAWVPVESSQMGYAKIDVAGRTYDLPAPPGPSGPDYLAKLCATSTGVVAVTSRNADIPDEQVVGAQFDGERQEWDEAVLSPSRPPDSPTLGAPTCTDEGAAIPEWGGIGATLTQWNSFDGERWVASEGPHDWNVAEIAPSPAGRLLDGELWVHDENLAWRPTGVKVGGDVVAIAPINERQMAVVRVGQEPNEIHLDVEDR